MVATADTELAIIVRLRDQLTQEIRKAKGQVKDFGNSAEKAGAQGTRGFSEMTKSFLKFAAAYGAIRFFKSITSDALEFRQAMSEVSTIVDTSAVNMDDLSKSVRDLATAQGQNQEVVAKGLYQTISAGITDVGDALKFLETAGKLGIAGVADTAQAVDVLSSAINAYGLNVDQASQVSDVLFKTVEKAKTTLPEIAQSFATAAPLAATLNVSLEEMLSAFAALTLGGTPAAEAFTQVNAILAALLRSSDKIDKLFREKLGVGFSVATIKAEGLEKTLQKLIQATGGDEQVLRDLLVRIEAVRGVFAITGNQADAFTRTLRDLEGAAGAAGVAFQKRFNEPAERLSRIANAAKVAFSELGEEIVLSLADASGSLGDAEQGAENLREAIKSLGPIIKAVTLAISLLATGVQAIVTSISGLRLAAFAALDAVAVKGSRADQYLAEHAQDIYELTNSARESYKALDILADLNERLAKGIFDTGQEEKTLAVNTEASAGAASKQTEALRVLSTEAQKTARTLADLGGVFAGEDKGLGFAQGVFQQQAFQRQIGILRSSGYDKQVLEAKDAFEREVASYRIALGEERITQEDFDDWYSARAYKLEEDLLTLKKDYLDKQDQQAREAARQANQKIIQENAGLLGGAQAFLGNATDELSAFADGSKSAGDAFHDFSRRFLSDIIRMIIQAQLLKATVAALGFLGVPAAAASQFFGIPSAKGNAFENGRVVPMARGGIVNRPTVAPLALMGERNRAEGVLPLARMSNGELGVQSGGQSRGDVHLHVGFLDTDGADAWLVKRKDTVAAIMRQAVISDPGLRSDFQL